MRLALYEQPDGVVVESGNCVVYDVAREDASFGGGSVDGPALVFRLEKYPGPDEPLLAADVEIDRSLRWIMRCDRIDFPPGGVAYTHVHPGPGIRYLLHGELEIRAGGHVHLYRPGVAWFEGADYPVLATAAGDRETAFVRVLLLPAEWEGKRTIRYVDPADEDRPKLQRPSVFFDRAVTLS